MDPSSQKTILSSDRTIWVVVLSSERLLLTPLGGKSDDLVIHTRAKSVIDLSLNCFTDKLELSPHTVNKFMNGCIGIGFDRHIGAKVWVFTSPVTNRLMSLLFVGEIFPKASNKHATAATAVFNIDSGL